MMTTTMTMTEHERPMSAAASALDSLPAASRSRPAAQPIRPTDDIAGTLSRVGSPATGGDYAGPDDTVFAVWEDRNPILHVLFGEEPKRPIKGTVFLAARSPAASGSR